MISPSAIAGPHNDEELAKSADHGGLSTARIENLVSRYL